MPALSYFNVITWFAPDSVVIANLVSKDTSYICQTLISARLVWRILRAGYVSDDL